MTGRLNTLFAAATLSVALLAGSGIAAAASFEDQLEEAKSTAYTETSKDNRSTVVTHLSVAEALHAKGERAEAQSYLDVARGRLGLPLLPPTPPQVGELNGTESPRN